MVRKSLAAPALNAEDVYVKAIYFQSLIQILIISELIHIVSLLTTLSRIINGDYTNMVNIINEVRNVFMKIISPIIKLDKKIKIYILFLPQIVAVRITMRY